MALRRVGMSFTGESLATIPATTSPGFTSMPMERRNSSLGTQLIGVVKSMPLCIFSMRSTWKLRCMSKSVILSETPI